MATGSSVPTAMQTSEGGDDGTQSQQSALDKLAWNPAARREEKKRQAEPVWYQYTSVVFVDGKEPGTKVPHRETRSCNFCNTNCNGRAVWIEHVLGINYKAKSASSVSKCTANVPEQVKGVALDIYNEGRGVKSKFIKVCQ